MKTLLLILIAVSTAACTIFEVPETHPQSGPSTETNAVEPEPELTPANHAKAICKSYCAWQRRCPAEEANDCESDCAALYDKKGPKLRTEFVKASAACFDSAACEDGEATCFYVRDEGSKREDRRTCLDRRSQCPATPSFFDEYCDVLPNYNDAARAQVAACLYQLCDDIPACIRKALY